MLGGKYKVLFNYKEEKMVAGRLQDKKGYYWAHQSEYNRPPPKWTHKFFSFKPLSNQLVMYPDFADFNVPRADCDVVD